MSARRLEHVITAHRQEEGAGFVVRRPFPTRGLSVVDPFLLLDEMGPTTYAPGEALGAPDHPHRGFETVTYLLEGEMQHEDSTGRKGFLRPGDVQWMTAGDGVVHSEEPSDRMRERGGRMHGFQIWVNLPAKDKRIAPRYQEIPSESIPKATTPDGLATVRVIAGEALGVSARIDTRTPIAYHHWTLRPGARVSLPLPASMRANLYVFGGAITAGPENALLRDGQLAILGDGDTVSFAVPADAKEPAEVLLLAGEPLREPVARYGPFVMTTRQEIEEAVLDYQAGRMGRIQR